MIKVFNPQTFRGKLAKLDYTQKSIETLSYWCIFHMVYAKQVVETWARQFYCSPRWQRLAYLYLANDILQNGRSKGSAFVNKFWTVLPDVLRSIIKSLDENGKKALIQLLNIWDERKVFGSKSRLLKEEFAGGQHMKNSSLFLPKLLNTSFTYFYDLHFIFIDLIFHVLSLYVSNFIFLYFQINRTKVNATQTNKAIIALLYFLVFLFLYKRTFSPWF